MRVLQACNSGRRAGTWSRSAPRRARYPSISQHCACFRRVRLSTKSRSKTSLSRAGLSESTCPAWNAPSRATCAPLRRTRCHSAKCSTSWLSSPSSSLNPHTNSPRSHARCDTDTTPRAELMEDFRPGYLQAKYPARCRRARCPICRLYP
ncbi:hypothetical protein FA95DRAFT_255542 [Auriscalpium vulgare]|uniref:Uncharacterized protein n=1 Tax=Auriscalpium vulgare TaxID=40419 RepID=A0ACB8RJU4_9AGAM|nr:hypothetical protein FA95DRAFT_255542 [Auriscalpium vulgare]